MKNIWSFLSFVVLLIILLVDLGTHFSQAQSNPSEKVINAQEFNLVDTTGRKCASFFVNSAGEASIQLGPTKQPGFHISLVTADGLAIWKGDGDDKGITQCFIDADTGMMRDKTGKVIWSIPK